jgi:signal transduction histidine kinase
MLTTITAVFALQGMLSVLWTAICFVVLYRPAQQLILRFLPAHANPLHNTYQALHISASQLTASLDAQVLVNTITAGVRATFGEPALAFYLGHLDGSSTLTRVVQERLDLPEIIAPGTLTEYLTRVTSVLESRALHAALAPFSLSTTEDQALCASGVALWCPIRHAHGHLLGVLVLGRLGDLDPYRAQDIRELQRLLDAAAFALTNSATYTQQCEAEATIRRLYQQLEQERAATAAAIARELHDEIININVRLNIESIQKLLGQVQDPAIRAELDRLLESERTEAQFLRLICERLHPTGSDDPLGLPTLLRMQVERIQVIWSGTCRLLIEHAPCPISTTIQREVLGVATEALTNAIKHATAATEITVVLRYPKTPDEIVQLIIRDNGRTEKVVTSKPGHWGVRGMYERAREVGGRLRFEREVGTGTAVILSFPPACTLVSA